MVKHINFDDEAKRIIEAASRTEYLSKEEERRLVIAMKGSGAEAEAAKAKLIASHQRLVINCAMRLAWCGKPLSDLIQEGNVGIVTAARKFDPERGVRFATYALWWVREAIRMLAFDRDGAVYVPPKQVKEIARMHRTLRELSVHGRTPSDALIAETMGIKVAKLRQLQETAQPTTSLNARLSDDSATEFGDLLVDHSVADPNDALDHKELQGKLAQALSSLDDREREIITGRFGLVGEKQTLEDLATRFSLTRERIRQLEQRALQKLAKGPQARILKRFLAA